MGAAGDPDGDCWLLSPDEYDDEDGAGWWYVAAVQCCIFSSRVTIRMVMHTMGILMFDCR